jgi:hypothetical protein
MAETGLEGFEDNDWDDILEELRVLVISSGFGHWDEAMFAHIEEEGELNPRSVLIYYLDEFMAFLSVRSTDRLKKLSDRLGDYVSLESGEPLRGASLVIERRQADIPEDRLRRREIDLLEGETSDAFIKELWTFRVAIVGEGPPEYFNEPGDAS